MDAKTNKKFKNNSTTIFKRIKRKLSRNYR